MASPQSQRETPPVPSSESGAFSSGLCGNCGAPLAGRFCSQCGEKKLTAEDYSLGHFIEEAVDGFTHFDTRFLRTFKLLLRKPGELSNAFFHGGRSRYTKPLSLFIIINVAFFLVQPHMGLFSYKYAQYTAERSHMDAVLSHLRNTGESPQGYAVRFDANLKNQKKSVLIVAVPVLALFMTILFAGSGRTYVEHLVFSVQVYAFLLAYLAGIVLFFLVPVALGLRLVGPAGMGILRALRTEFVLDLIFLVGAAVYMYLGFRRAYGASRPRSAVNAVLLSGVAGLLIAVYHKLLFYLAFWTT